MCNVWKAVIFVPNCAHFSRGLAILYLASHTFTSLVDALCNLTKCSILQTLTLSSFVLLECKNMERTTPKAERSLAGHVGRDAALHGGPRPGMGLAELVLDHILQKPFLAERCLATPSYAISFWDRAKGSSQSTLQTSSHCCPSLVISCPPHACKHTVLQARKYPKPQQ